MGIYCTSQLDENFDRLDNSILLARADKSLYKAKESGRNQYVVFESDYDLFKKESRTFHILELLENKSSLQVDLEADDLLPSINPSFDWIRLAQRIPVRIRLDELPEGVELRVGTTASVEIHTKTD